MEEPFTLTWDEAASVVQEEEVICGIENECTILPTEAAEFVGVCEEVVVQEEVQEVDAGQENIMYLSGNNVLVMQPASGDGFEGQFIECQVAEEVVTEQWNEVCPEIVVGSEEHVGGGDEQTADDIEIPLPTDQDQYTASRPYPCDFCSRRFRKKANLMNHMVAHQTDRPHGCNLCGVRYIRKCDLMNHLKIHAYIPETDNLEEEDAQPLDDDEIEKLRRSKAFVRRRKNKTKVKEEYGQLEMGDDKQASSSRAAYDYVDEDVRLMEAMENNVKSDDYLDYLPQENHPMSEPRYPITDPRKPFVCQHCGVGFAREKALASHARVHGGDSPFECQKCGEMFWDAALMREHVRLKHSGDDDAEDEFEGEEEEEDDDDYSDDDSKYGQFFCPTCGMSFHRQDNLKRHQRIHVKEEYVNESEFSHVCNVCGESFLEALDLLAHAEIHARGSEHRCMICGEVCLDDQAVAAHVQSKHGKNLTPNTCMLCGRVCKDRKTLLKHSWEHSKEKLFSCSKCAKNFHNKARLKRHMLSHRNKAVQCDVCGEDFPDGRSLMNHRHSHSSVSGRQFPCRECGKTFGSRSSQQIHIRIHTGERPYGCRFCWKAFADGGTLRKHERIHTGEKPYACAVCPRAFNQRVVLREHIRSHHSGPDPNYSNSMTPYCCSVCSDMFATSQDLIIHLIHHCDLNTAMKRQPQVGPRKYKRRRKLKPHELEMMQSRGGGRNAASMEDHHNQQQHQYQHQQEEQLEDEDLLLRNINTNTAVLHGAEVSDDERRAAAGRKSGPGRKGKKSSPAKSNNSNKLDDSYAEVYNSLNQTIEAIDSIVNTKAAAGAPAKAKKKPKAAAAAEAPLPSRPKMIHTQKTRVAVETTDGGKVRHRTKTLVTRTQPTELKSATGERIRPRTKNVSYHIFNSDKLPVATFPEDDAAQAVSNLLASEGKQQENGFSTEQILEITKQEFVEDDDIPVPTNIIKVTNVAAGTRRRGANNQANSEHPNSLKPGRHIIGPASKVVRIVKGGMIVSKKRRGQPIEEEPENIIPDVEPPRVLPVKLHKRQQRQRVQPQEQLKQEEISIKQEVIDPSPLHELAEISMQHAQNKFKCDICGQVYSDRARLLDHVRVHI